MSMNIPSTISKVTTVNPNLPPLVKQSASYKLFIPRKVEEKIRYLLRKFPSTEWSGVLFTRHNGTFEGGDLEIHCEDIYPMDLGNSVYTVFNMNEEVTAYIADNIDLFGCDLQLVHSHHNMPTIFSGTDLSTLREEGNDRNCFVSLIVNNAGTYSAAITRKVHRKTKITTENLGSSYEFFGDGMLSADPIASPTESISEEVVIEYFMLNVDVEHVDNPFAYLDTRFDEIKAKRQTAFPVDTTNSYTSSIPYCQERDEEDTSFAAYLRKKEDKNKEPLLFSDEEMAEMVDLSQWVPDKDTIHYMVCQMVTCSLIINKNIDLEQWINKHMVEKYSSIFDDGQMMFEEWKDFIVEFQTSHYSGEDVPAELFDDPDTLFSKVAEAMYEDLSSYATNEYIEGYKETLNRYIYE